MDRRALMQHVWMRELTPEENAWCDWISASDRNGQDGTDALSCASFVAGARHERARLLRLAEEMRIATHIRSEIPGEVEGWMHDPRLTLRELFRRAGEPEPEPEKQPLPKRIRITKTHPGAWYLGRLGEVFHVHEFFPDGLNLTAFRPCFLVAYPGGSFWAVLKSDCEPVPDEGLG